MTNHRRSWGGVSVAIHWGRARVGGPPVGFRGPRRGGCGRPLAPAVATQAPAGPLPSPPKFCSHSKKGAVQTRRATAPDPFGCGCQAQKSSLGKNTGRCAAQRSCVRADQPPPTAPREFAGSVGAPPPECSCRYQRVATPGRSGCRLGTECAVCSQRAPAAATAAHSSAWSAHPLSCKGVTHTKRRVAQKRGDAGRSHIKNGLRLAVRASTGPPTAVRGDHPERQRAGSSHQEASTGPVVYS